MMIKQKSKFEESIGESIKRESLKRQAESEKIKILKQSVINWIGLLPENVDTDLLYSIIYILNEHKKGKKLWKPQPSTEPQSSPRCR